MEKEHGTLYGYDMNDGTFMTDRTLAIDTVIPILGSFVLTDLVTQPKYIIIKVTQTLIPTRANVRHSDFARNETVLIY